MCTAVASSPFFGRTLDLDYTYSESVTIVPRNAPLPFRHLPSMARHHALIGIAYVTAGYPLYYDAANEHGLAMAALRFPDNARYHPHRPDRDNVASFELMVWILGQCSSLEQALARLERVHLCDCSFRPDLPPAPLHWMLTDGRCSFVLEPMADGLHIHPNPVGVLTNNPSFPEQLHHLARFYSLSAEEPENRLFPGLDLKPGSWGTGALGLPGDFSSPSRFVRAAFLRATAQDAPEEDCVGAFFHRMDNLSPVRGSVRTEQGNPFYTQYTSCCRLDTGTYYYTTHKNRRITAVELRAEPLEGEQLISYPLLRSQQIFWQNGAKKTGNS